MRPLVPLAIPATLSALNSDVHLLSPAGLTSSAWIELLHCSRGIIPKQRAGECPYPKGCSIVLLIKGEQ